MVAPNETTITEVILIGLSDHPQAQTVFFWFLLIVYLVSFVGNDLIVVLIIADSRLHSSMYFFLCILFSVDFIPTNNSFPEAMVNCFLYRPAISFYRCLVQVYAGVFLIVIESVLLATMAYDRFAAVCHPLRYTQIMSWRFWIRMVSECVGFALLNTLMNVMLRPTDVCGQNVINHFSCELHSFLRLACSDKLHSELYMRASILFTLVLPFVFIVVIYGRIGLVVLCLHAKQTFKKALSTCGSHLAVVSDFFGTIMITYLKSQPKSSSDQGKIMAVMYGALTPMFNSLRNRDVKNAFWRMFGRKMSE